MSYVNWIFDKKLAPGLMVFFVALVIAQWRIRLRKNTQSQLKRVVINSFVAVPSFGLLRFVFLPAMVTLASINQQYGIFHFILIPAAIRWLFVFLILDYGNYLWHVLNHKLPFLWRFHLVHHTDLDLDIFTAFRFHFGELIGSVFFRGFFVLLSGAGMFEVLLYELFFEAATQFHHSNLKLPYKMEVLLNKVIVTPRMHGIHHSVNKSETDSNYSVIFSFWDRLHRTFQFRDKQDIIIGVPSYRDPAEMTIAYLLLMPFKKIRDWKVEKPVKNEKEQV